MENIEQYKTKLASYALPRINEIPDLDLYMDQVIIYVKKYFSIFPYSNEQNFITPSMINNYVKSGLVPAPLGKKYNKRHIAYIFAVFFLKQIFSLEEAKAFIALQIRFSDERTAYEAFCNCLENELKNCASLKPITSKINKETITTTLEHTALSIANKLYAQTLIKMQIIENSTT